MVAGLHKIVQHHLSSHVVGQVPLVVAYSGGLDSACLLRILATLAPANQLDLLAVTVDHGLRDFHREVELTASYCQQLAVRHELVKLPLGLARRAEEQGRSLLEMARLERFQELRRLAAGANIFLAHHLDDQAETMIMRLMRGTGLQGLGAMRPVVSDLHRPLLPVTRGALEAFAAEEAVPFVEDPSNTSPRYLRNRVRQEVMPAMGAIGEGTIGSVARSADILSDQFVALATLLEEGLRAQIALR